MKAPGRIPQPDAARPGASAPHHPLTREDCLALDALFKHLGMEITEEDIEKEFSVTSNPEATRKAWEDAGRMSIIREAIKRQRATKWLVDNAVVTIDDDVDEKAED